MKPVVSIAATPAEMVSSATTNPSFIALALGAGLAASLLIFVVHNRIFLPRWWASRTFRYKIRIASHAVLAYCAYVVVAANIIAIIEGAYLNAAIGLSIVALPIVRYVFPYLFSHEKFKRDQWSKSRAVAPYDDMPPPPGKSRDSSPDIDPLKA